MQQTVSEWSVGGVRVSHQTNTKQNLIRNSSWPGDTLRLSMQLIRSWSWGLYCRHYIHTHTPSFLHAFKFRVSRGGWTPVFKHCFWASKKARYHCYEFHL